MPLSQDQKDQAAGRVLLEIWKIFHSGYGKRSPTEIVTRIAQALASLPPEQLNSISAEAKRRRE